MTGRHGNHLAGQLVAPAGVVFKHFRYLGDLNSAIAHRLAGRDRFQLGQLFRGRAHLHTAAPHQARPSTGRQAPPDNLGFQRRLGRSLDHRIPGVLIGQKHLSGRGIDQVDGRTRTRHQFTANPTAKFSVDGKKRGQQGRYFCAARVCQHNTHSRSPGATVLTMQLKSS